MQQNRSQFPSQTSPNLKGNIGAILFRSGDDDEACETLDEIIDVANIDDNICELSTDIAWELIVNEWAGICTAEPTSEMLLPLVIQPPKQELKPLPNQLKYMYLEKDKQLPIIIAQNF